MGNLASSQDIVKLLLTFEAVPDFRDENGWTPLSYASYYGHIDLVRVLLEKTDLDFQDHNGKTALMKAVD